MALIGGHERCDARVGGSRGPDIAYLVCAFRESVEVWPLAPIAFPRWGIIQPHQELLVGSHRITVEHPCVRLNSPMKTELPSLAVSTTLFWDARPHPKIFRRQVTILGEAHPSVIRLHGRGLHSCDHAAIVQDGQLWLVDLVPERWGTSETAPVQRLGAPGASGQVGNIMMRMVGTIAQQSLPPEAARVASDPEDPSSSQIGIESGELDGGSDSDLLGISGISQSDHFPEPHRTEGSHQQAFVWEQQSDLVRLAGTWDPEASPMAVVAEVKHAPTHQPKSEQLTARVTQRLVSLNQTRFLRQRAPWVVACLAGFALALIVIARLGQLVYEKWLGGGVGS